MTNWPRLTIHFSPGEAREQANLQLTLFHVKQAKVQTPVTCLLVLPFSLAQVLLVLRALNARQYPDYPTNERLIKSSDDRTQIISELQTLGLWKGSDTTGAVVADVHKIMGKKLGETLLSHPSVELCLDTLYEAAIQEGGGEVVLIFDPRVALFAALPWEVTHNGSQPILLTHGVVLGCTRIISFDRPPPLPGAANKRLHVLTIAPNALVDDVGRAFEELARSHLRDSVRNLQVDIEPLSKATMRALYERLGSEPAIDVLDYYGHGRLTQDGGVLIMDDEHGGSDPVDASRLQALGKRLPSLIVLHACHSAQVVIDDPLLGIAAALSDAGVRAVVAMQFTNRMTTATNKVTPMLYRELVGGKSIQQAIAAVRQMLYTTEPNGTSWYVPVLYLRQSGYQPFVLLEGSIHCPPNPFIDSHPINDPRQFIGRDEEVQRLWDRLNSGGNLSIVGVPGAGKSAMLALIVAKLREKTELEVIWLPPQRTIKESELKLMLARKLGGQKAKATDLIELLEKKHLILLLDDLGQLDKGERGRDVRLWLRELSQNRSLAKVQLVATSLRRLDEIFQGDESKDYSPLHNVMTDVITLGTFTDDEARRFITKALERTPFQLKDFTDLLTKPMLPRKLEEICRDRYDELCKRKVNDLERNAEQW